DPNVMRWQDWLTPVWQRVGGGCHLNRKMDALIESARFSIDGLSAGYQDFGPRPFVHLRGHRTPSLNRTSLFGGPPRDEARLDQLARTGEITLEAKTVGDDLQHIRSKLNRRENVIG